MCVLILPQKTICLLRKLLLPIVCIKYNIVESSFDAVLTFLLCFLSTVHIGDITTAWGIIYSNVFQL